MRAISIGIPFIRRRSGVPIDAQAQAHFNRVIADGGVVPSGLSGVNAFFSAVKAIYGTSDINTAISAAYDPHYLGYRLGAGSGTTLGQAARTLYAPKGIFGGIGTGSAFWEGVGVSNNFVTTPNAAANQITGDIDIRVQVDYRNNAASQFFVSKTLIAVSNHGYDFFVNSSNLLLYQQTRAGVFNSATSSVGIGSSFIGWLRMTRVSSTGVVTFFTSLDGVNYTQLGTTFTLFTGALDNPNSSVNIGSYFNGNNVMNGKIYRATISNTINGTPVVDFNANQYTGANTWTSTTGEVWTVNSTGAGLADVTQTTAASQPLLLAHTGENYWFGSGVTNNFVSTPNAAANQITGDIDIIYRGNFITNPTGNNVFIGKWDSGLISYYFGTNGAGNLRAGFNVGGSTLFANSSATYATGLNWYRVTRSASTGVVTFFQSTQNTSDLSSVTWTQLGTTQSTTAGSLTSTTSTVSIFTTGTHTNIGTTYRATIANSIGGTPVVDFNPSSYNPSVSQTQWTSATGEVWTINTGTATTGYKGQVVTKTTTQSDGIDDRMQAASYALTATGLSVYSTYRKFTSTSASSFSVVVETSANHNTNQGFIVDFNDGVNTSFNGIRGNVGYTNASFLDTSVLLKLVTSVFDLSLATEEASFYAVNNSALTKTGGANSNNTTMTTSGLNLMSRNNTTTGLANMIFDGLIISNIADNSTQRTAMYNYLRSLNNNAF